MMANGKDDIANPGRMVLIAVARWVVLMVACGMALRVVLMCHPLTAVSSMTVWQVIGALALGAINDAAVATVVSVPLVVFWLCSGHWRFKRPQCFVVIGALVLGWVWLTFGCPTLWEFNRSLARIVSWVMVWWTASFALRAFVPRVRRCWMRVWTAVLLTVYLLLLVFDLVGEWFFWNEFGVRYNFIAVDYLVYTTEVVGNIMQSYSVGWIGAGVVIGALALEWLLMRHVISASAEFHRPGWRPAFAWRYAVALAVAAAVIPLSQKAQHSQNVWFNELQANGVCSLVKAFTDNKLDYNDFYIIVPSDEVARELGALAAVDCGAADREPITPNIILVTMESMSADYMERFGNTDSLTPNLDSLWRKSLAFEQVFAAGNRTVRGLEALMLSRPPSPGESIIKRPDNTGYPSVADKLRAMGYGLAFYYGGNSYFDNMESFYTGMGFDIRDRKTMRPDEVSCQTVWGVCDGDVYARLLRDLDSAAAQGKPVFAQIMTTSNHRPYIYPDGCVSIPPTSQSRRGAVMYSDYALGRFIEAASAKPWFDNTVFVIVADHCASSAGSTELPLENYHIPALIYGPALIAPAAVSSVASQIDVLPTLFGLLGWDCDKRLYGRNVLADGYEPRAFVATYQDLGYLSGDTLTVLSPGRTSRQFVMVPTADNPYASQPVVTKSQGHINRAAALYQSLSSPHN